MDISEQDWYEVDRWFQGGGWRNSNLMTLRRQLERISPRPRHQNPPFLAKYDLLVGVLQQRIGLLEEQETAQKGRGSHSHIALVTIALLALLVGLALGIWSGPYLKQKWQAHASAPATSATPS